MVNYKEVNGYNKANRYKSSSIAIIISSIVISESELVIKSIPYSIPSYAITKLDPSSLIDKVVLLFKFFKIIEKQLFTLRFSSFNIGNQGTSKS